MDVWSALLGNENTSNQELSDLSSNRHYSVVRLVNKYANFSKEVSSLEKESHIFKSLSGSDKMSARQIYEKPVDFKNIARLIISANQLPSFKIVDKAVLRRFDYIADTQLNIKLIKELPGILNLVLSKAKSIIQSDDSINLEAPESIQKNLKLFSEGSSLVAEFINDRCEINTEYITTLKSLYESYVEWCRKENGVTPKKRSIFKDELDALFNCDTEQINSVRALSTKMHKKVNWVFDIRMLSSNRESTAMAVPIKERLGML